MLGDAGPFSAELSVTLDKLYDTRGGSFGSGSSSSDLYTNSHVYANGVSGYEMGSSDVLVYQFQTEGSYGGGQLTFTRSNETALWDTDAVVSQYNNPLTEEDFTYYGSYEANVMFGGGGAGYYADVYERDGSGGGGSGRPRGRAPFPRIHSSNAWGKPRFDSFGRRIVVHRRPVLGTLFGKI